MQEILLIKHGALGDLIQAMGILQAIRAHYSQARLTLLTSPAYASLMQSCPWIDVVWTDSRGQQPTCIGHQLQTVPFDLVIDLQNSDRSRWYRWRWLRQARWLARPWWAPAPVSGLAGLRLLCAQQGISTASCLQADLRWLVRAGADALAAMDLLIPYVVLIPGASRQHPGKRWPHYAALAQRLQAAGHTPVAVLGPDEAALQDVMPCRCLYALDWPVLAAVLAQAQAVVGNDTGPSHLAAHVGARGFALFGPTSALRAEIDTELFSSWQCQDLATLDVEAVWVRLSALLKT